MSVLSDSVTVNLDGAEAVRAVVSLGSGKLGVSGGGSALMEGTFEYSDPAWKPIVAYEVENGVGTLQVKQPHVEAQLLENPQYVWDLVLGNEAPLSFSLKLGSGSADLKMAHTRLSEMDVKIASGNLTADLSGDQADLTRVALKSASGRCQLVMDGTYPILETVDLGTASGATDVALAGDFPMLRKLEVDSASGRVRITLSGTFPVLEKLSVNVASGAVDLDLAELRLVGCKVSVSCVSGKATVTIAKDAAATITFTAVSGKLVAPGFHREGKDYVNAAWTAGEPALRFKMSSVSGKLVVHTADEADDGAPETAPVLGETESVGGDVAFLGLT